jgi:hypothetical protein
MELPLSGFGMIDNHKTARNDSCEELLQANLRDMQLGRFMLDNTPQRGWDGRKVIMSEDSIMRHDETGFGEMSDEGKHATDASSLKLTLLSVWGPRMGSGRR